MQEAEAEFYKYIKPDDVSDSVSLDPRITEMVYSYWLLKRRSNLNRPLVAARYRDGDEADDASGRRKRAQGPACDQQRERLRMFLNLRQDLERVSVFFHFKGKTNVENWSFHAVTQKV
jgi:hypothetical protein